MCKVLTGGREGWVLRVVRQSLCLREFHLLGRQTHWTENGKGEKDKASTALQKEVSDTKQKTQF